MKTEAETAAFLKSRVELFADFPEARLERLVAGSRVTSFEANEVIAHYGAPPSHFGVVLEGAASGSVVDSAGARAVVSRAEPGGTFGEMAIMTGDSMLADVIAETRCEVLLIPVPLFRQEVIAEPAAVQAISRTISGRFKALLADPSAASAALRENPDPYGLQLRSERPEKVLVVNCGSSSLKYSFYDTSDDSRRAHGQVERVGASGTRHAFHGPNGEVVRELPQGGFPEAFAAMVQELTAPGTGVIGSVGEVSVVAHRVVHGGERFTEATLIDDAVVAAIEELSPLAPLHNPVNVAGIRQMRRLFPAIPHVAVFDTAFHHTLPAYAYLYGLPYELYQRHGVRRYGFHGSSHAYVSLRAAQFLGRRPNELEIVSCHLGNGSSLCAIDHGRSIDTTMGLTPVEGLIMGTRSGDVDPGAIAYLQRAAGLDSAQVDELINKKSGLLGLSGVSSDMREVLEAADGGNAQALIALKAYCYRVRKYIGAYVAAMGGLDVIVFTGGIGQGSEMVRALALQGLEFMGIELHPRRNREARGFDDVTLISADLSKVAVLVVPADEERMLAREALRTLERSYVAAVLAAQQQQPFLVEISAHHVHLTQDHVEQLFGAGHQLTRHTDLSQPGQFASKEQVAIIGPKGQIDRVRVLGPVRKATQVEIAMTEQFKLGIHPPVRESGDIADTPGCTLAGPEGQVVIDKGVICALRHMHMTPADALRYGVRDKSFVRVRVKGEREVTFGDVLVRVDPGFSLAMHIDTDEGNAAGIETGAQGFIEGIQESR